MRQTERVTPLELFFDLVFVLALTQCTALMAADPTWTGLGKGLLVLGVLWWSWVGYAWLTSVVDPEEGGVRIVMFAAMAALLVAALCVDKVTASAMLGGTSLYLLGHVGQRLRNVGTVNKHRLLCAVLILVLIPLAVELPALAALAILAVVLWVLIGLESIRFVGSRQRARDALAD